MLKNQGYYVQNCAHEFTVLIGYFKLADCFIRKGDCSIRVFRSFCMFNQETVIITISHAINCNNLDCVHN